MKIPLDVSGVAEAGRIATVLVALRLQIEAMAEASSTGEPSAYTAARTVYRAFSSGRLRVEGDPPGRFEGTFEELVNKTLEAVQAYRDEIAGPVDLVWRTLPEHSVETVKGRGAHNIYLRLAFEPAAVQAEAAPVASLAEARAFRANDAELWTPVDALRSLLRRIEAGEVNPERLAIHTIQREADGGLKHGFTVAGLTFETHLCLLEIAKQRLMDDWRR